VFTQLLSFTAVQVAFHTHPTFRGQRMAVQM
jgi:hypothetical protein